MISEDMGLNIEHSEFNERYLGTCKKVTITKDGQPVESGTSAEPSVSARAGVIVY